MTIDSLESRSSRDPREGLHAHQALLILIGCLAAGLAAIAIFALRASAPASWASVVAFGIATAGASTFVGGLIGFLFGIPRRLQQEEAKPERAEDQNAATRAAMYGANTNLEQISDWLTKILVGVGLVNLRVLSGLMQQTAVAAAPGFGGQAWSGAFAVVIVVYFFVGGFLIGYLATRLYLGQALTAAERTYSLEKQISKLEQQASADALALQLATAQLTGSEADKPPQTDLDAAVTGALGEMRAQIFYRAQLQRLRNWRDEATKPKMERTIAVFRALIASDSKDNYHANHGELGFALKDQRTPDWSAAESELSRAIIIRGESVDALHRPYEANRALCLVMLDEPYRDGKPSSDETRLRIVEDLKRAILDDATKTWVKSTLALKKWLALNKLDLTSLP